MALQTAPPSLGSRGTPAYGSLLFLLLSLEKACPLGQEAQVVDENLVFYEEWELEACVDGALLAAQMGRVNLIPFTYQQLHIFKRKLDEFYPQGYPQSLIEHLRYFFLYVTPEDIHKWNVTSLDTVKSLLKVSQGRGVDAQVAALIARYVGGGGQLDKAALDTLATFRPAYLCFLRPEQLGSVQLSVLWMTTPQDLDACRPPQMVVLYHKARMAFQNVSGSEYIKRIKPFLEASSGGPHRLGRGPGPVLTVTASLLLASVLS
ncbi:hypothetical protein G4228_006952 [Cervus hanglu yarkandensis]|nr:hypothetical protein G4228_006952 [Cervus hanglu yarkandensis]